MTAQLTHLHWLAVLAAFAAYFILGGLWFTVLFGKPYAYTLGRENDPPLKPGLLFIAGPALCALVITITTAVLMATLDISTIPAAIELALWIGLGYLVANTINIAINPNMPRPISYGLLTGAYHLTGIIVVCLILVAMK